MYVVVCVLEYVVYFYKFYCKEGVKVQQSQISFFILDKKV